MRTNSTSFTDLNCWQKARSVAKLAYAITKGSKDYVLTDQFRRAAISIMNNIAEGYGKSSEKDKCRFFDIAIGSANELVGMTYLMEDIEFSNLSTILELRDHTHEVYKMTIGLANHYRKKKSVGKSGEK